MARADYEQAIRLYLETSGDEELAKLVAGLSKVGDEADEGTARARTAFDKLAQAMEEAAQVDAFVKTKKQIEETERELEDAQQKAKALFRTLANGDGVDAKTARSQERARKSVNDLTQSLTKQRAELQKQRAELARSGISTTQLGTAQGELRAKQEKARAELSRTVRALHLYRVESQQAAKDIPATNERIAQSYGKVGGALNRLRSLAAPVLTFLSFEGARRGIVNLAGVAQKAEDARRSLGEMYGDAERGNRVYSELEAIARRNGLAMDATVAAAQKLKNFGLDPLNGSLQALIDQNAAVGGSQQDLEGKILALGQAWAKQKLQGEEILQLVERGVPVWDLLQQATGKNVQELQKLSEAGKLGRDVISQLYETIGQENAGAAQRSLGSLSGLIERASARWLEFRQKIVDAGVGDYLKQQLQSILDSTGGMDALAKRVSDGIVSTLDALRRFGTTLAPIAAIVRDSALALAEHARQVVFLAKGYAVLKLAQYASQFSLLTRATLANAAASTAAGRAAAGAAGKFGFLGTAIGKIPPVLRLSIAVAGIDWAIQQFRQLEQAILDKQAAQQAQERFDISQRDLQREQLALGQQLQQIYKDNASTAIKAAGDVARLNREEAGSYKFALEQARQYYAGVIREARATGDAAREAMGQQQFQALGNALAMVQQRITDIGNAAAKENRIKLLAIEAVEAFDTLIAKGETTRKAVDGLFKGIDWTDDNGLAKAAEILSQMEVRGKAVATAVREELAGELKKLAAEDLPGVEAAAVKAFGAGSAAALAMADAVDRARFDKLGIDLEAIRTGFTKAGREVVTAFEDMVGEIDDLGLSAEQKSAAIAQAFDNAFRQASTKQELAALKQALQDALSSGDIGFAEFQQRIAQTDAALEALKGTGAGVGDAIADGAGRGGQALAGLSSAASDAAGSIAQQGDAAITAGEKSKEGAKGAEQMQYSLRSMSDAAVQALSDLNRYAGSPLWSRMWNDQMAQIDAQYAALQGINDQLDRQLAKMDPLADKLQALRAQYDYVDEATLRGMAEKQKRVEDEIDRKREEAKRERQRILDEAQSEADRASGDGSSRNTGRQTSTIGRRFGTIRIELPTGDGYDIPTTEQGAGDLQSMLSELARAQSTSQLRRRR